MITAQMLFPVDCDKANITALLPRFAALHDGHKRALPSLNSSTTLRLDFS